MERPLRQKPSPYPGAVAWSRDNILAVGQERSVALLNPADLVDGDAGFVRLADDTAPGSGAQDAAFPAGIENQRRHTDALAMRGMLHRPARPEVAARQVAWSPVLDVKEKNTPPRSVLLVVSTTHAVTVHAPSARDTGSEWPEVCDLSQLERMAREREDEAEDATATAAGADTAPAPRAPRETSAHVASILCAAAALPALPAPPATPAAAATARCSLPAPAPAREPSPPPPNALEKGARAEVDRGDGEWLPATAEEVLGREFGPFRVKVRYVVPPAKDADEEWLVFAERPELVVWRTGSDEMRRDERFASHFKFPPANAAAVGNVPGKNYRLRSAALGPEPRAGAAGAGDPKPELADARPFAMHADSASDDDTPIAMLAAAAAAAPPDPPKPAAKRARTAAPAKVGEKLKEAYTEQLSAEARGAARAAVEKARAGGSLAPADAAATATKAVFEKASADEKMLACVATTDNASEVKRARNDALVALSHRARDAFLEARAGVGSKAVYAKGKHIMAGTPDGKCLDATIATAKELIEQAMKKANVKGAMDLKAFAKEAKKFSRLAVGEPTTSAAGAGAAAAAPPPRAARRSAAAVVVVDSDSDSDDAPIIDMVRSPRPAASGRTAQDRGVRVDHRGARSGGCVSGDVSSLRRAERLAALCAAWSSSSDAAGASLVAVGAKSGDAVLWSARARLPREGDGSRGASRAMLGVEMRRLGSTRVANAWVTALAWADDGASLVVGASDGTVTAWRVAENAAARNTSGTPLLERSETFCAADGVTVTALAVDETANRGSLVAAGKASGAVSVFRTETRAPEKAQVKSSRVFFEPVAGAAWCASPLASGVSRLVVTSTSGRSTSMDATEPEKAPDRAASGPALTAAFELTPPSVIGPAPLRVPGAAAPDGADVPADFYAGIAASPAGVFVARARAFHNSATASFHVKGNEKDGKTQIAARMRRGALAIENALGENPDMLERAVARAASARSKKETSLGSLWDVRAAAAALGAEGHAAASRGADGAAKRAGRDEQAKARAARMRNALVSASEVSLPPDAPEGLACRACGAREDSADSASRVCARCALPLRAALESTMGLKSVVI